MNLVPERVALETGGRVLLMRNPASPFISFHGSLPAGVAAEGRDEEGVAEFLSRLLLSGTERMNARKVAEVLEGVGATLEFHNAEDIMFFRGRCTRDAAPQVFPVLGDCLANPVLPAKEVERIRGEILTDIERERDSTRESAERGLLKRVFPRGHPYGRDPKGDEERVRVIEPRNLFEFHERTYGAAGVILALAGDVDVAFVRKYVAPALAVLRADAPPPPSLSPEPAPRATEFVDMPHKTQADIALGLQVPPRSDPGFYALSLANLLFGVIGMYGRLGQTVREDQGLAYYSFTRLRALRAGGHWGAYAGVNPARLDAALEAIRGEIDRLRTEPFTEEEVDGGRQNMIGSLAVNLERNAEVAGTLHEIELHDLGIDFLERYASIVRGLSREDVVAAAERHFRRAECSLVVVGPIGDRTFSL